MQIDPTHLTAIIRMHAEGRSAKYIGQALRGTVGRDTVRAVLKKRGLMAPQGVGGGYKRVPGELRTRPVYRWNFERERDLALRVKTQSVSDIARAINVSADAIYRKLKELEIEPPRIQQSAYVRPEPVVLQPVRFPQFCDIERPDRDRYVGKKPQRQHAVSLTGNAAQLCAG